MSKFEPAVAVSQAEAVRDVIEAARYVGARGWVPATSGNFSRRVDQNLIAITKSGCEKAELVETDVAIIDIWQPLPKGVSAETPLHVSLYQKRPDVACVLHTHSMASVLESMMSAEAGKDAVRLTDYELLKAIPGHTTHEVTLDLPLFANDQDVPALAARVEARLPDYAADWAYLLTGHGLYAWGRTPAEARRITVALEYLLTCEIEKRKMAR